MKGGKKAKSSTLKRFRKTLKKKGGKKGRKTIRKSRRMHNRSRKMRGGSEYDDTILEIQGDDEGDNFNFSTLPRYTQLKKLFIYSYQMTTLPELPASLMYLRCSDCPLLTCLPELPATLTRLHCSQEYFIDKYDYKIDSSNIERFRNDPITIKRRERKTC